MARIRFFLFFTLLSFVFLCSCIVTLVDMRDDSGYLPAGTFHEQYRFSEGGVVSVANERGDVEIIGWEREGVDVYAEKMFYLPRTGMVQMFRRGLVPDIDVDRSEDYIHIKTESGRGQESTGIVSFSLRVPHAVNLERISVGEGDIFVSSVYGRTFVELDQGNVTVENYSGMLTVFVKDGMVDIGLVDVRADDRIAVNVERGGIVLHLEEGAAADIEASVLNGTLVNEFVSESPPAENRLSYRLGAGGAVVSLSVSDGDITLKRTLVPES